MPLRRRTFLGLAASAVAALWQRAQAWAAPITAQRDPLSSFPTFLNTLLPADSCGPSAVELEVDQELLAQARSQEPFARLLHGGCRWLDTEARALGGVNFVGLGQEQREALVSRAAQAERKTLPREFFEHVRRRAFRNYYGQPTAWLSLGYGGPPQPNGFPDHDKPPPKAEP